jgi:C-terminal processing protease CtpA/Prc
VKRRDPVNQPLAPDTYSRSRRRVTYAIARVAAVLLFALSPIRSFAQPDAVPPLVWYPMGTTRADFDIYRDTNVAHTGRASLRVAAEERPNEFATVAVTIPAAGYAGHRIRFSMYLRTESLSAGGAMLWARADDANHRSVAFINTQSTPLVGTTPWTRVEIALDIPPTAASLYVGVISAGSGSLWADDALLESEGAAPSLRFGFEDVSEFIAPARWVRAAHEAPRAITARGLANVIAFTKALGYVRFFHPSEAAVSINWDEFAIRGVRGVEKATTTDSLIVTLRALFAPFAPTVTFTVTGATDTAEPVTTPPQRNIVYWRHEGVGVPSGGAATMLASNIYRSERITVPLSAIGTPVQTFRHQVGVSGSPLPLVPDPTRPFRTAIERGITITVPLALYTADERTPDSARLPVPAVTRARFSASDRAVRLADVALAWSLLQHFYPYFDVIQTDWPRALTAALTTAATDRDVIQFRNTLLRLTAALHDGHGRVTSTGSGLIVPDTRLGWAEGQVVIVAPGDSGMARGLRAGDVVTRIGGQSAHTAIAAASELISGATPQWIRERVLSSVMAGEEGGSISLSVRGVDGRTRDVLLPRWTTQPAAASRPNKIAELSPGVIYVDIDRITDADFAEALPRLASATGIVFDMRGYPRQVNAARILAHLTDSTIHSAHFEVPVLTRPDRGDIGYTDVEWTIPPAAPRVRARLAFLSGGGAISAMESTLGVVEGYSLGAIVGEPSAGTNGNVNPFALPGGYVVTWTGMRVVKRDGSPHHGVGIIPTVPVSPTIAGIRAGRDEVLERAVAIVRPED